MGSGQLPLPEMPWKASPKRSPSHCGAHPVSRGTEQFGKRKRLMERSQGGEKFRMFEAHEEQVWLGSSERKGLPRKVSTPRLYQARPRRGAWNGPCARGRQKI